MNTRSVLSARILEELNEISTAAKRVKMAWRKAIDKNDLQDYRSFRHLVRNIYTYNNNPEKIKPLVQKLPSLLKCINKDLKLFNKFLQTI